MKKKLKSFLNTLPYIKHLYAFKTNFEQNSKFPPGHYYSPIVDVKDVKSRENKIWEGLKNDSIAGVDLNTPVQLQWVEKLKAYYKEIPFSEEKTDHRYYFKNDMYAHTDGIFLYGMMRCLKPNRIIEVGSGFSSALMLDVNELFLDRQVHLTFIEPHPERLYQNITNTDKKNTTILESKVQEVPLSVFAALEKGDILFIDSTHVSKCGSDLNYLLFEVIPSLANGVFIHIHDIFYPFEYPKGWVYEGRNWNENYLLRAFLMNNASYDVVLFSHYLHLFHSAIFKEMPLAQKNFGGNLWLEKKK